MLFDPKWEEKVEVTLEPWQEILLKAADILETEGWIRGRYISEAGFCAIGAIRKASGLSSDFNKPIANLNLGTTPSYLIACRKLEMDVGAISSWNDTSSKKIVIDQLRKVANAI